MVHLSGSHPEIHNIPRTSESFLVHLPPERLPVPGHRVRSVSGPPVSLRLLSSSARHAAGVPALDSRPWLRDDPYGVGLLPPVCPFTR